MSHNNILQIYGASLSLFRDFASSMLTMIGVLRGSFNSHTMWLQQKAMLSLTIASYVSVGLIFIKALIIAFLSHSYHTARNQQYTCIDNGEEKDYKMIEYFGKRLRNLIAPKKIKPVRIFI